MPPGAIPFPFGICRVCKDKATGVHYGVATCEGCKGFFKRTITRGDQYKCFFGGNCDVVPKNRNRCKSCRFRRCIETGMSVEAVRMGRIPKVEKEKALEVFQQTGADFNKMEVVVQHTGKDDSRPSSSTDEPGGDKPRAPLDKDDGGSRTCTIHVSISKERIAKTNTDKPSADAGEKSAGPECATSGKSETLAKEQVENMCQDKQVTQSDSPNKTVPVPTSRPERTNTEGRQAHIPYTCSITIQQRPSGISVSGDGQNVHTEPPPCYMAQTPHTQTRATDHTVPINKTFYSSSDVTKGFQFQHNIPAASFRPNLHPRPEAPPMTLSHIQRSDNPTTMHAGNLFADMFDVDHQNSATLSMKAQQMNIGEGSMGYCQNPRMADPGQGQMFNFGSVPVTNPWGGNSIQPAGQMTGERLSFPMSDDRHHDAFRKQRQHELMVCGGDTRHDHNVIGSDSRQAHNVIQEQAQQVGPDNGPTRADFVPATSHMPDNGPTRADFVPATSHMPDNGPTRADFVPATSHMPDNGPTRADFVPPTSHIASFPCQPQDLAWQHGTTPLLLTSGNASETRPEPPQTPSSIMSSGGSSRASSQWSRYSPSLLKVLVEHILESQEEGSIIERLRNKFSERDLGERTMQKFLSLVKEAAEKRRSSDHSDSPVHLPAPTTSSKSDHMEKFLGDVEVFMKMGFHTLDSQNEVRIKLGKAFAEIDPDAASGKSGSLHATDSGGTSIAKYKVRSCDGSSQSSHSSTLRKLVQVSSQQQHKKTKTEDTTGKWSGSFAAPVEDELNMKSTLECMALAKDILYRLKPEHRQKLRLYNTGKISLRVMTSSDEDVKEVYTKIFQSIPQLNERILGFCENVRGFPDLSRQDREVLQKRAFYDIWMLTYAEYFYNGESHIILSTGELYTIGAMRRILNDTIVDSFLKFSEDFNALKLSDLEVSILCAVQLTSPDGLELDDLPAVQILHSHLIDVFDFEVKRNHGNSYSRLLIDIFKLMPALAVVNRLQHDFITTFKADRFERMGSESGENSPQNTKRKEDEGDNTVDTTVPMMET